VGEGGEVARQRDEPDEGVFFHAHPLTRLAHFVSLGTLSHQGRGEKDSRPRRARLPLTPAGEGRGEGTIAYGPGAFYILLREPLAALSDAERGMTIAELVYEQVKALPDQLAREVLDFAFYLRDRQERREWRDLAEAQAGSLAPVWDNAEDEVWNNV
jgi:hypothetical protein